MLLVAVAIMSHNQGRILMLFTVAIVGVIGVTIGFFFRVSALAAASFGLLIYSVASNVAHGTGTLYAIAISFHHWVRCRQGTFAVS